MDWASLFVVSVLLPLAQLVGVVESLFFLDLCLESVTYALLVYAPRFKLQ